MEIMIGYRTMLRIDNRGWRRRAEDDVAARALFERQLRKVIPGHWSGWAHLRKAGEAGRRIQALAKAHYEQAAALGNGDAKTALMRAECSYVIKDKRGNFVANLCF
jgi:hypothetical protein